MRHKERYRLRTTPREPTVSCIAAAVSSSGASKMATILLDQRQLGDARTTRSLAATFTSVVPYASYVGIFEIVRGLSEGDVRSLYDLLCI